MRHEINHRDWEEVCPVCGNSNLITTRTETDLPDELFYEIKRCSNCDQVFEYLYDMQFGEVHYETPDS